MAPSQHSVLLAQQCKYELEDVVLVAGLTGGIVRGMGADLTGHLAAVMGPELTASIVHNSGIKTIGKLVGQMGGGVTGGCSLHH